MTLALNMIVRDEAQVVARCLESVKPLVDRWVIVDTGSTDGTQDVVRACMAGVPGELHERPWQDFGRNRTEGIELARGKADYLLVMDADDHVAVRDGFRMPPLAADAYLVDVKYGGMTYGRPQIFRADLDYRYEGVVHETLVSGSPRRVERLEGFVVMAATAGARSRAPDKYAKDAALLRRALFAEPGNARCAFYLAQSLRDAGELEQAREAYAARASMDGWEEETWYALVEVARLGERLRRPQDETVAAYRRAFQARPTRAEPLVWLAAFLRRNGRAAHAYLAARTASAMTRPADILFVDDSVYTWRALDEYATAAYLLGRTGESLAINLRLLAGGALPDDHRGRILKNVRLCSERLGRRCERWHGLAAAPQPIHRS